MEKEQERENLKLYSMWPIYIWQKCSSCKHEFRREAGWRFVGKPFYAGRGTWNYLCAKCAPDEAEAHERASTLTGCVKR